MNGLKKRNDCQVYLGAAKLEACWLQAGRRRASRRREEEVVEGGAASMWSLALELWPVVALLGPVMIHHLCVCVCKNGLELMPIDLVCAGYDRHALVVPFSDEVRVGSNSSP